MLSETAEAVRSRVEGQSTDRHLRNRFETKFRSLEKYFYIEGEIGRGSSGVVRKCIHRGNLQPYACKSILKSNLNCDADLEDLKAEITSLKTLNPHPAVLKSYALFEDETHIHLVMEYCSGGDLFDRIKLRSYFSELKAAQLMEKLASALAFAHEHKIMHRDLKPENILLVSEDSDTDIRLADFGSSTQFNPGMKLSQLIGSPLYVAPSVLRRSYGPEADLWSLGVVMYVILAGVPPFWGRTRDEIFHSIMHGSPNLHQGRMGSISDEAKDLLSRLLVKDVDYAITALDVLVHPWIVKYSVKRTSLGHS